MEGYPASNSIDFEEELFVWCQEQIPLDYERSRIRVQPPIRIWSFGCRIDRYSIQTMEISSSKVSLWGWIDCWCTVSLLISIHFLEEFQNSLVFSPIVTGHSLFLEIKTDACKGSDTEVNYLEHVQAVITANASRRGDLELFLTSPMGTRWVSCLYFVFVFYEFEF